MRTALLMLPLLLLTSFAFALSLEEPLKDEGQEARAKALFQQIRCMVCQGESVADSRADVASDMRREIRARIAKGESEADITAYLAGQYGVSILMTPPFVPQTLLLWFGPALLLLLGIALARRAFSPPQL